MKEWVGEGVEREGLRKRRGWGRGGGRGGGGGSVVEFGPLVTTM